MARRHSDAHLKHLQRGESQSHPKRKRSTTGSDRSHWQHPVLQYPSRDGRPCCCRVRCGKGNAVLCSDTVIHFGKVRNKQHQNRGKPSPGGGVQLEGRMGAQLCLSPNHKSANSVVPHSGMRSFPIRGESVGLHHLTMKICFSQSLRSGSRLRCPLISHVLPSLSVTFRET